MNKFNIENQEIISGSSRLVSNNKKFDRIHFAIDHMDQNLAYKNYLKKNNFKDEDNSILKKFKDSFMDYRKNWNEIPKKNYDLDINDYNESTFELLGPLCVDIEIASICDLACPHCFREYILTPDKIMNFDLYKKIIDQIHNLNVPSITNWQVNHY